MKNSKNKIGPHVLEHRGGEPHLLKELYLTNQSLLINLPRIVGTSVSRLALLRLLAIELVGETGTMEIARRLGVNPAAVTRTLNEMEEQKWVRRGPDPKDGRHRLVRLTQKGHREFHRIHERMHELESSIGERLGTQEVESAVKVLVEIRTVVEKLK